jgi:hypothetical protein
MFLHSVQGGLLKPDRQEYVLPYIYTLSKTKMRHKGELDGHHGSLHSTLMGLTTRRTLDRGASSLPSC